MKDVQDVAAMCLYEYTHHLYSQFFKLRYMKRHFQIFVLYLIIMEIFLQVLNYKIP